MEKTLRFSLFSPWFLGFAALLVCTGPGTSVRAEVFFGSETKITASDAASGDEFGFAVDIDGDTAVVGAHFEDGGGTTAGAAYVFDRNQGGAGNWGQVRQLKAGDPQSQDQFGFAVAASTNAIVVGAPFEDEIGGEAGAAYVFERDEGGADNWGQAAKLVATNGVEDDAFGYAVSVWGNTLVIGAPFVDAGPFDNDAGAAYIFARTGPSTNPWVQVTQIVAADADGGDEFGFAVAMYEDTVVVGAPGEDTDDGAAYVFYRDQGGADNWGQVRKVVASGEIGNDRFGESIDVHGDAMVVGAPNEDQQASDAGAAYVYERNQGGGNNWGQVAKLTASDGGSGDHFGTSVSVYDDAVLAGAPEEDEAASNAGAAYIYRRDVGGAGAWGESDKAVPTDGPGLSSDQFGIAVAVGANTALTGRYLDDSPTGSGSAYLFDLLFNFAPVVDDQVFAVLENTANDTVVDTVVVSDVDVGDDHTFEIIAGNSAGAFSIESDLGEVRVADSTVLDHESLPQVILTVEVTDDGTPPLSDTASVTINITDDPSEVADLEVVKTAPAAAFAGEVLPYTLTVTNHGPNTASDVALSDTLPADVWPTGVQDFDLGTLPAGSSTNVVLNVVIDDDFAGSLVNVATVSSIITDNNSTNDSSSTTTTVTRVADLSVNTVVSSTLTATNRLVYTVEVENIGPSLVDTVVLTNVPGPDVTYDPAGSSVSCAPVFNIVECGLGLLSPGETKLVTIEVVVDDDFAGSLVNLSAVGAPYPDPVSGNNISTGITEVTDFDMDGLPDFSDPDDDNDWMPDDWELLYGLNPMNAADGAGNLDGDPSLNAQEYIADTIPTDSNSFFRIVAVTNQVEVRFLSSTGRVYTLESSDNLSAGIWTKVSGQIDVPGAGGLDSLSDTNTIGSEAYRVGVEVP